MLVSAGNSHLLDTTSFLPAPSPLPPILLTFTPLTHSLFLFLPSLQTPLPPCAARPATLEKPRYEARAFSKALHRRKLDRLEFFYLRAPPCAGNTSALRPFPVLLPHRRVSHHARAAAPVATVARKIARGRGRLAPPAATFVRSRAANRLASSISAGEVFDLSEEC